MSFNDIGDGTKDVHYREYRLRQIRCLMEAAAPGATFTVQFKVSGTELKSHNLNLSEDDMEILADSLESRDPEREGCRGCAGTCCTGAGSDPCTC